MSLYQPIEEVLPQDQPLSYNDRVHLYKYRKAALIDLVRTRHNIDNKLTEIPPGTDEQFAQIMERDQADHMYLTHVTRTMELIRHDDQVRANFNFPVATAPTEMPADLHCTGEEELQKAIFKISRNTHDCVAQLLATPMFEPVLPGFRKTSPTGQVSKPTIIAVKSPVPPPNTTHQPTGPPATSNTGKPPVKQQRMNNNTASTSQTEQEDQSHFRGFPQSWNRASRRDD